MNNMTYFLHQNPRKPLLENKIKPIKKLGQNFLIDQRIIKKIIKAACLEPNDVVLEIGAGTGLLTIPLAQQAKKIIAVEKDRKLSKILKQNLEKQNIKNVEVIEQDILKLKIKKINSFKVVANLPYYITSPVIRKFLESNNLPERMILTIQKEVAQRITSKPPEMNLLALSVQFYAQAEIISFISKKSFWPVPKVDSAIIEIKLLKEKRNNKDLFFKIVKAGFASPRKQLLNNLSKKLKLDKEKTKNWLLKNNVKPEQRAETLTINDWINLTIFFKLNLL